MSKNNQLKVGSILSYAQMAVAILINLVYTPVMIRLLGKSEYGLYNTVASTISMLSVLNLGFSSSYIRYYSKYKAINDQDGVAKLNGLFFLIFSIIGAVAFFCGMFLTVHLNVVFEDGLTSQEYSTARVLMLLLTINLTISFPMSVFSNIIAAHECFCILKLLGILKTVFGPLLTLPLLLMGYRSVAMVSVTVLISAITDVLYIWYTFSKLSQKFVFRDFEKGLFRSLLIFTSFIAINMIVDQINTNIDKILLGRYKGTEAVAMYSVGFTLYQSYMMFSTSVSGVFTPRIHMIITQTWNDLREQRRKVTDLFIRVGRIQFLILALVASGFVFFGKAFIVKYWAGEGYDTSYYVGLLLILPSSIALIQNLGIEIQRGLNRHQFRSIVYLGMALVNLILSIYLCQLYGAVGSAIGTAISLVLANGLIMNIYYHKHCNIDIILFWKNIGHLARGLILPISFAFLIRKQIANSTFFEFIFYVVCYTVIYFVSMWLFGMNPEEKNFIENPVKRVTKKVKGSERTE